jgi:predicted molibdopterin-dependent oxidoreductase YjgC
MPKPDTVELTIDGKKVQAQAGQLLMVAAREAGFDIPSLCWHRKLSPTGACRLCVVKIEGQRGLVTSCSTKVEAGMTVTAFDEELETERKFLLASLMSEVGLGQRRLPPGRVCRVVRALRPGGLSGCLQTRRGCLGASSDPW